MKNSHRKTLATILAVSMVFSAGQPNKNFVVALPPEKLKIARQDENVKRLKK